LKASDSRSGRIAITRDPDLVALHAQRALERLRDLGVVLDHEDPGWARVVVHPDQRVRRQASKPLASWPSAAGRPCPPVLGVAAAPHLPALSQRQLDLIGSG
jgi:hypothetical protein